MTKRRTRQKWSKVPVVAMGYMVAKRSRNGRSFFWMLKLVTAFAAAFLRFLVMDGWLAARDGRRVAPPIDFVIA